MTIHGFFQDFLSNALFPTSIVAGTFGVDYMRQSGRNEEMQLLGLFGAGVATGLTLGAMQGGIKDPIEAVMTDIRHEAEPQAAQWLRTATFTAPAAALATLVVGALEWSEYDVIFNDKPIIVNPCVTNFAKYFAGGCIATAALVSAYDHFVAPNFTDDEIKQLTLANTHAQTLPEDEANQLLQDTKDRVSKSFVERVRGTPSQDASMQQTR
ncbi:MAG: hypothetical protein EAZ74_00625 [Alphaproteobacteria bacterium]|nr:MAG: hypothetical protein EAY76_01325 [Alphaproteobacteria bacterium]TAF15938.1 MAG: hypothetical protein EAZ74_00625 [Alphaproteobacteria bacterium]TAF41945.1 MAG: hypothetical protein EAZ66_00525 [Alphaproteobacteria bacterium]TAF76752.1 MAG: hypothetical protein EAZ52_03080 [Alphaproteobacteria bacterium]